MSGFLDRHRSFQFEGLLQKGPIQEIVELAAGDQGAHSDASMPFTGGGNNR